MYQYITVSSIPLQALFLTLRPCLMRAGGIKEKLSLGSMNQQLPVIPLKIPQFQTFTKAG